MERIINILEEYAAEQHDWDSYYCDKIESTCLKNKSYLIDLLSKHPQWDAENYRVHFNADFSRTRDEGAADNYLHDLLDNIDIYMRGIVLNTTDVDLQVKANILRVVAERLDLCRSLFLSPTGVIEKSSAYRDLLYYYPEMHLREGAKCTKSLLKILRQYGFEEPELFPDGAELTEQRRLYAMYADNMTPLTIKRHTVLSVNPCDFLLMSHGVNWQSCHSIIKDGCYQAGCWSYAYDSETMILYVIDEDVEDANITFAPKIYRQLYHWNGSLLYGARLYPQECDNGSSAEYRTCREIVESVIATCLDKPNLWKQAGDWHFDSYGLHYPDYDRSYCSGLSAYHLSSEPVVANTFIVGSDEPICPVCGKPLEDGRGDSGDQSRHITCTDCATPYDSCDHCGVSVPESELTFVEYRHEYVCRSCLDRNYYWSEVMGDYIRDDDVERFCDRYGAEHIATAEWLNDNGYDKCCGCGEWRYTADGVYTEDGNFYCEDCVDEHAFRCNDCEKWYDGSPNYIDSEYLCDTCYAERKAQDDATDSIAISPGITFDGKKFRVEVR